MRSTLRNAAIVALAAVALVTGSFEWAAMADSIKPIRVVATPVERPLGPNDYAAVIRCGAELTEDSATHLRLVAYERQPDGSLTIRLHCKHGF